MKMSQITNNAFFQKFVNTDKAIIKKYTSNENFNLFRKADFLIKQMNFPFYFRLYYEVRI